jgi:hypothetical protein
MTGVTWLDGLQAVGVLATAAGVFLAWIQLKHHQEQLRVDFEDRLSQQYREAIAGIPIDAMLGRPSGTELDAGALTAFYRYFDLTNEQIYLQKEGRISDETWESWLDGIRMNMRRPAFVAAWGIVAHSVPESFDELRALIPPPSPPRARNSGIPTESILGRRPGAEVVMPDDPAGRVLAIRKASNASWSNIRKAIAALSGMPHEPFGSPNVENTSKSIVRRMSRETRLSIAELSPIIDELSGDLAPAASAPIQGVVEQ